jgi:glycosyltransferase involved in cell wall biosynthesis
MTFTQSRENIDATPSESTDAPESVGVQVSLVWVFSYRDVDPERTLARYIASTEKLSDSTELIIVNNGGSSEKAQGVMEVLEKSSVRAKLMSFHRNTVESAALSAAFKETNGEEVVVLPSYLQIDPDDIGLLLSELRNGGCDYVASWRSPRVDSKGASKLSSLFNSLTRRLTCIKLHDVNSGMRAMKRQVIEEVQVYGDLARFLPVLAAMQGFRTGEVKVRHLEERVEKGDYRLGIILRRLLDMLTLFFLLKFTRKPLRFFGLIGSATLAAGLVLSSVLVIQRMLGQMLSDRPLFLVGMLLVVLGVQLFSIGLLGELIIFIHARDIREYKVDAIYEFDGEL